MVLGWWGHRNADVLAPAALDHEERAHRARALRAGGLGCAFAGVLLLCGAVVSVASG